MNFDYHLDYLRLELARLDLLFQQRILQLQAQRAGRGHGLVITEEELLAFFEEQPLELSADAFADLQHRYADVEAQKEGLFALGGDELPRFMQLCQSFDLSEFEQEVLLLALAPILDPRYERIFGYLQNDITVRRPTVHMALDLIVDSPSERLRLLPSFMDGGRLIYHKLVHRMQDGAIESALPNQQLGVDEAVVAWLLGEYHPDPRLLEWVRMEEPNAGEEEILLTQEIWEFVSKATNGQTVAIFHGDDEIVQLATARMLASSAELPLLWVDMRDVVGSGFAAQEAIQLILRDGRMTGSAVFVRGWDAVVGTGLPRPALLQHFFKARIPVIVSSEKEWYVHGVERSESILRVKFERPSYRQRRALWHFYTAEIDDDLSDNVDIAMLASQFALDSTQIRDAVASARDIAIQRDSEIGHRDLVTAARIHSSPNLSGLAHKIEPRYEWNDVVLPADQRETLRELIQTVKGRGIVMEEWGVGDKLKTSSGVTVLFAGPPGTGKTLSAEVIAGELGLDLYKLDLSMVVSKFIGETEKNLGKIFDEAQSSSAVLFFDEADSIFGKRSEVKDSHDRYANMEISYLLQRMEVYDGVTILATNLRANMDEAFTRRMQFIVDFPFPDEQERLHIWRTLLPPNLPMTDDINLELLATRFKLAGGNIRNIIASAAFLAASNGGVVSMDHLLHSTRRELQKMGRLVSDMNLSH